MIHFVDASILEEACTTQSSSSSFAYSLTEVLSTALSAEVGDHLCLELHLVLRYIMCASDVITFMVSRTIIMTADSVLRIVLIISIVSI